MRMKYLRAEYVMNEPNKSCQAKIQLTDMCWAESQTAPILIFGLLKDAKI